MNEHQYKYKLTMELKRLETYELLFAHIGESSLLVKSVHLHLQFFQQRLSTKHIEI